MSQAVIGCLLSSSVITLVFVPTIYAPFKTEFSKKHLSGNEERSDPR
jgi:Cu/Ag efflux pump CusA